MSDTEKRTMKSWGHTLSDPDATLTANEAMLLASLTTSDRLLEIDISLQDIKVRLLRIELWMEHNVPGYTPEDQRRYLKAVEPRQITPQSLQEASTNGTA